MHHTKKFRSDMTCPKHPKNQTIVSIPIELLEEILRRGWLCPMFMQERIAFMTSVALVSKRWLETLIRITFRDVYIHSTPYYLPHCRELIVGQSPFFHKFLPDVSPGQLCRTITQQIPLSGKINKHGRLSLLKGKLFQNMLSTFHGLPLIPNLRTLTVECHNPALEKNHFLPFHAPIVQVDLEYTFASDCPSWLINALLASRQSKSRHLPWALPHLEHISTAKNRDPIASIVKVLDSCPHLRLAEERFAVRVRIFSSSRRVPEDCTIVHGVMPSPHASVMNYHDFGPNTVRGSAHVLVLMNDRDNVCGPLVDLANMFRNVHVFLHQDG